jgi:CRP-like cAMP-binding protein
VKKTVVSEQGKEAVVALLGTGNFFGEGCLTGQPLRLSTVSAMTECVIVRVTKADIRCGRHRRHNRLDLHGRVTAPANYTHKKSCRGE